MMEAERLLLVNVNTENPPGGITPESNRSTPSFTFSRTGSRSGASGSEDFEHSKDLC